MRKSYLLFIKVGSVLAYIVMIVANTLANTLPINDQNTGEVAEKYENLFTPAGITFSIWIVIYFFLFLYVLYQTGIFTSHTMGEIKIIEKIGPFFILSCLANAAWIFAWHYELILLSVFIMLILLATLIFIYLDTRLSKGAPLTKKLFISMPFSLYLGWITVATIANITTFLVSIKWDGWGIPPQYWTTLIIFIAVAITLLFQKRFKDKTYSAVIIWALIGILIRQIYTYEAEYPIILGATILGIIIILVGTILLYNFLSFIAFLLSFSIFTTYGSTVELSTTAISNTIAPTILIDGDYIDLSNYSIHQSKRVVVSG